MSSPAERYAAAKERQRLARTALGQFLQQLPFEIDDFQRQACEAIEAGQGVLVAAPTGAGKTLIGQFAIHRALQQGKKAFYTTPIKALSNQKYAELCQLFGVRQVGLLTGDTSINSEAPIVVMTTEVLRNMLYAASTTLLNLGYVIMDEVHYLADRFRGAVWEEVIIHLPDSVQLVSLSATVSNAEEFGAWLDTVRGETQVIVSEHRPVPLWQNMMVGQCLYDLFTTSTPATEKHSRRVKHLPLNKQLLDEVERQERRAQRSSWGQARARHARYRNRQRGRGAAPSSRSRGGAEQGPRTQQQHFRRTSRPQVVTQLSRAGLLPAIYFIFSRAGCDEAVQQCRNSGLSLTSSEEQRLISARMDQLGQQLPAEDLGVLGFWGLREAALHGIGAHHAGLLPVVKEAIEDLFCAGLLKVVFATETLALGINMPAKTVVLEKLQKFNGIALTDLSAGEYTQLTGRAGRRGIDIEGHAVVVYRPGVNPKDVAGLASTRTYPLNSSFAPTYNMSINLVAQYGAARARRILQSSFAQFQADRSVVGLAQQMRQQQKSLAGYAEAFHCSRGDFREYARLRRALSDAEKAQAKARNLQNQERAKESLFDAMIGDVLHLETHRNFDTVVVLSRAHSLADPRIDVLTEAGEHRQLAASQLKAPVQQITRLKIPAGFAPAAPKQRRKLAEQLRQVLQQEPASSAGKTTGFRYLDGGESSEIQQLRKALKEHPCHYCPDREDHARWAVRWAKLDAENQRLKSAIAGRTGSIAAEFDRYCALLTEYGYLLHDPEEQLSGAQRVTDRGHTLRKLYGEKDLLTAEVLHRDTLKSLRAKELAAYVSVIVYEAKRDSDPGYRIEMPTRALAAAIEDTEVVLTRLRHAERRHNLPRTERIDTTLVWPLYQWASGKPLSQCIRSSQLSAGDFVRWVRQCIDVLEQITQASSQEHLRDRCQQAVGLLRRGVVDYIGSDIIEAQNLRDDDEDQPGE